MKHLQQTARVVNMRSIPLPDNTQIVDEKLVIAAAFPSNGFTVQMSSGTKVIGVYFE
jgi:hypothetical protein